MQAWRITKKIRALDRSGFGASITGQRWNSVNIPAIYAGLSLEIAALEKLVHTGSILPLDLVIVEITLPDDSALFESPHPDTLLDGWDALPASSAAATYGDNFLLGGKYLGLIIPSAIIPEARNIVINPAHPSMQKVTMVIIRNFTFDARLRTHNG